MATLLSALETQARRHLVETTARYWSSAELIDLLNNGIKDLWGAIIDLGQEHFLTVDVTNVSFAVDGTSLTGVPTNCFRVHLIEPRDTTSAGDARWVRFVPKDYNSSDFINARASTSLDPTGGVVIYYTLTTAGAPVAAPTVLVAPPVSTAINLRFVYVPILAAVAAAGDNPIPGESDMALIAYCVAFARAKERDDRSPDPNWLAIYGTEKMNLLVRLTPRQTQEPNVVDAFYEGYL